MKPLTVYRASAGSGKTFRLAVEYIKLVVSNPQSYHTILAVTFTNKATEEMKMRILSQLYGISRGLPDSRQYEEKVMEELDMSQPMVRERAGKALNLLLHDYGRLRVMTIDSFFQIVLRNLARELDLTANLRLELNDSEVEAKAVDELIDSLDSTSEMLQWLMDLIREQINDDKSWNVIRRVKDFGKSIYRLPYRQSSKELSAIFSQPDFFSRYTERLQNLRSRADAVMKEYAETFFDALEGAGLSVDDLRNRSGGVAGYFIKLRNGKYDDDKIVSKRVTNAMNDAESWATRSNPRCAEVVALASSELQRLLNDAEKARPKQLRIIHSVDLTLQHISHLRLLGNIEKKVREINNESNQFLLSDTQHLLNELIDKSDSPFIFERIGSRLEHIMIDEFQDTSTVQWENFKVLLSETMSHGGQGNLIVGDVKQSIYRWRNGDWRLLNNIENQFDRPDDLIRKETLEINYRSEKNIITFNSVFFETARDLESKIPLGENLVKAYSDVKQNAPEGKEAAGLVKLKLLDSNSKDEEMLAEVISTIDWLIGQGTPASKIAILVRENKYIPIIAEALTVALPEVSVVSDEAFRLDASRAVNIIISALRLMVNPADKLSEAILRKQMAQLGQHDLPDLDKLRYLPLLEIVETLHRQFCLDSIAGESVYLCSFYDQLTDFITKQGSMVEDFIKLWDEHLCSQTIAADQLEGIRIISVHKSKGLEFDHVILPFCNWKLVHREDIWCRPQQSPYDELPVVPISIGKKMKESIYQSDYDEETLQNRVDNLNLLYVAFTRASRSLFVFGKEGKEDQRSFLIANVMRAIVNNPSLKGAELTEEPLELTFGTFSPSEENREKSSRNVFLQPIEPLPMSVRTYEPKHEFRQSNRSRSFVDGEDDADSNRYVQIGSVLHQLFSTIRTTNDIDAALRSLEMEGLIYDATLTADRLREMLRKRLNDPRVADWFSSRWKIFNECSILTTQDNRAKEYRPDRVMTDGHETVVVDFKFGKTKDEHQQQVGQYVQLLRQMGYPNVSGWLWYVYSNKTQKVEA